MNLVIGAHKSGQENQRWFHKTSDACPVTWSINQIDIEGAWWGRREKERREGEGKEGQGREGKGKEQEKSLWNQRNSYLSLYFAIYYEKWYLGKWQSFRDSSSIFQDNTDCST